MADPNLDADSFVDRLLRVLESVLGEEIVSEGLAPGLSIGQLGIDSIGAVEVIQQIEDAIDAPSSVVDDYYVSHPGMPGLMTVGDLTAFWRSLEAWCAGHEGS